MYINPYCLYFGLFCLVMAIVLVARDVKPVFKFMSAVKEKRRFRRKNVSYPVRLSLHGKVAQGEVSNMSQGGLHVMTDTRLYRKNVYKIEIDANETMPVVLDGAVAWVRVIGKKRAGIVITPNSRPHIQSFCKHDDERRGSRRDIVFRQT